MLDAEEKLVQSARLGDRAAFEELVRRTSRLVYARLFLETGDAHQAEDLLQDTLLTAFRTLGQLADSSKFRPWLLRIAQNQAIDAARRNMRLKRTPNELRHSAHPEPAPDEQAELVEQREQVLSVLRTLPEEYRLPLTLRYLAGADYDTIQMQMGLTNGSLRGLLHRGLKLLKTELEKANVTV
jgi:RNA polymerase sigma-70 factor (ECF subfamily)